MYKGVKMNKKIFILVFLFIALISMSAVSAADLDDSNETVALSEIGEGQIAVSNDVNAIDDLNKDDSGSEAVLGNAVKSSVAGEKEILGVENSGSEVLGATGGDPLGAVSLPFMRRTTSSFRGGSWGPGNPLSFT